MPVRSLRTIFSAMSACSAACATSNVASDSSPLSIVSLWQPPQNPLMVSLGERRGAEAEAAACAGVAITPAGVLAGTPAERRNVRAAHRATATDTPASLTIAHPRSMKNLHPTGGVSRVPFGENWPENAMFS